VAARDLTMLDDAAAARLVDDLYSACGLDYRGWASSVVAARLRALAAAEGAADLDALRAQVLDQVPARDRLVVALAARVDGPFPDVDFARLLRREVCPRLRTYPSIRIWHAGCSTGEEAYTTAIILREEGLYERSRIYATDLGDALVGRARSGVSQAAWAPAAARYLAAGGTALLDEYYRREGDHLVARPSLRARIAFDVHSLATDASFNEFQLIVCRGVLPAFAPALRQRALRVIGESLCPFGFLALGGGEGARVELPDDLEAVTGAHNLYRRSR
jgi:chemotaxis protein methyltransferase CheR